jgi:hypothetical protein
MTHLETGVNWELMKFFSLILALLCSLPPALRADPVTDALSTIAQQHAADQAQVAALTAQVAQLKAAVPIVPPVKGWLGTNIAGNSLGGTDAKWIDLTHQAGGWYNTPETPAAAIATDQWGGKSISPASFNADGYPLVPAESLIQANGYPPADYAVSWAGSGTVEIGWVTKWIPNGSGNGGTITLGSANQQFKITIHKTDPANPVRQMRIVPVGTAANPTLYRAQYTALLAKFSCLRSMDAQSINTNDDIHWPDRVTPSQWCQTGQQHGLQGMALEYLVAMANEAHVDLWVNIPINADADYVAHMAQICHGVNGRVHVEYGNEIWNSTLGICAKTIQKLADDPVLAYGFDGTIVGGRITPYLDAAGKPKLGTDSLTRAARCAVERARANAVIFRAVFADRPGALKCVWAGQAAWDAWAKNGLEWEAAKYGNTIFDELAIAPYFVFNWKPGYFPATGGTVADIFSGVDLFLNNDLPAELDAHQKLAAQYRLSLVAYESGQHFYPQSDIQQQLNADPTGRNITDITYLAQLDPRMGTAYTKYMQVLHDRGVTLDMNYSFISPWSKWGYWGSWRSLADSNPRTAALLNECQRSN